MATNAAMQQAVNAVIARAGIDPNFATQLAANRLSVMEASGVEFPPAPTGPDGQSLTDQYNASFADIISGASGKKRGFDFAWNGTPDSAACWACVIGVNAAIWGIVTAATVAAVIETGGAVLAPLFAAAEIAPIMEAGYLSIIRTVGAKVAEKSPLSVALMGVFVNELANAICNSIPNCCNSDPPQDNGIWVDESSFGDSTNLAPTVAVAGSGSNQTLMFAYQDNGNTPYLWARTWLCGPDTGKGWAGSAKVLNPSGRPFYTKVAPAAAGTGGVLVLAFVDADPQSTTNGSLVSITSKDYGKSWSAATLCVTSIVNSPALAVTSSHICAAYRDTSDNIYYILGTVDGDGSIAWGNPTKMGVVSIIDPGLGVFNNVIYCGYKPAEGNGLRYVTFDEASNKWSSEQWLPSQVIGSRPAFGQVGSEFMYLTNSPTDNHLCYATTSDGQNWSNQFRESGNLTTQPPALVGVGSMWYAFYKTAGSSPQILWAHTTAI